MFSSYPSRVTLAPVAALGLVEHACGVSAAVVDDVAPDHVLLAAVAVAGVPVLASAVVGHAQLVQVAGGVGIAVLLDAAIGVWNSAATNSLWF